MTVADNLRADLTDCHALKAKYDSAREYIRDARVILGGSGEPWEEATHLYDLLGREIKALESRIANLSVRMRQANSGKKVRS